MKSIEVTLLIISAIWFIFITLNVSATLGVIFIAFTVITMIMFTWDKIKTTPIDSTKKLGIGIIGGAVLYIIFVILNYSLVPIFEITPLNQILQLISASTPILAASKILNTITYFLFIPFIETIFFVSLMDLLASKWNISITKGSLFRLSTILLIGGLSFIFLLFHLTAKGITNNVALLTVFLMMVVSLTGTIWFGESKQAIIMHIIANGFGLGLFSLGGIL